MTDLNIINDCMTDYEFDDDVLEYFTYEEAAEFSLIMDWSTHSNYSDTIINRSPKALYEWVLKVAGRLVREGILEGGDQNG